MLADLKVYDRENNNRRKGQNLNFAIMESWLIEYGFRRVDQKLFAYDLFLSPNRVDTLFLTRNEWQHYNKWLRNYSAMRIIWQARTGYRVDWYEEPLETMYDAVVLTSYLQSVTK